MRLSLTLQCVAVATAILVILLPLNLRLWKPYKNSNLGKKLVWWFFKQRVKCQQSTWFMQVLHVVKKL